MFTTSPMVVVDRWTGRQAFALQTALRLTNETFARHLGVSVRAVAKWHALPHLVPVIELQRALDTVLSRAGNEARQRFLLLSGSFTEADVEAAA